MNKKYKGLIFSVCKRIEQRLGLVMVKFTAKEVREMYHVCY